MRTIIYSKHALMYSSQCCLYTILAAFAWEYSRQLLASLSSRSAGYCCIDEENIVLSSWLSFSVFSRPLFFIKISAAIVRRYLMIICVIRVQRVSSQLASVPGAWGMCSLPLISTLKIHSRPTFPALSVAIIRTRVTPMGNSWEGWWLESTVIFALGSTISELSVTLMLHDTFPVAFPLVVTPLILDRGQDILGGWRSIHVHWFLSSD